jgi:hypothetical protein
VKIAAATVKHDVVKTEYNRMTSAVAAEISTDISYKTYNKPKFLITKMPKWNNSTIKYLKFM